ncbi:MAG TPA: flagellar hook-basal body complex protein FliE [Xanthobacteraceae bacterium]|nr:flagellar hook-basal body complex protein FliE [Xanthobacteraceae bacterium]
MPTPTAAANAYAALARLVPASPLAPSQGENSGFGALLQGALDKFVAQGHEVDAKATALAAGKADLIDVVTAVAESEVAVGTLVSVRDKVISAYEEIMRMPI